MESDDDKHIFKSFMAFVSGLEFFEPDVLDAIADEGDVVAAYVVNSIKQFYAEYESHKIWLDERQAVEEFAEEIGGFLEVIDAYLVGFGGLDRNQIVSWLVTLKKELDQLQQPAAIQTPPPQTAMKKVDDNSSDNNKQTGSGKLSKHKSLEKELESLRLEEADDFKQLVEMFPSLSQKKVFAVYHKSNKNYEQSVDRLLELDNSSGEEEDRPKKVSTKKSDLELSEEERRLIKEKTIQK